MIDEHGAVVDHRLVGGAAGAVEVSLAHGDLGDVVERVEPLPTRIDPDVDEVLPGREGAALEPAADLAEFRQLGERVSGLRRVEVQERGLVAQGEDSQVDPRAAQRWRGCFSKLSTMSKSPPVAGLSSI